MQAAASTAATICSHRASQRVRTVASSATADARVSSSQPSISAAEPPQVELRQHKRHDSKHTFDCQAKRTTVRSRAGRSATQVYLRSDEELENEEETDE